MTARLPTQATTANVAFHASRSTNQSIPNAAWTVALCDTELFDTAAAHNPATGRFTAPVAGYYQLQGLVDMAAVATGGSGVMLRVNGTTAYVGANAQNLSSINRRLGVSELLYLAASDYVELLVIQDSGGALNLLPGSRFSGRLVGV